ncbi:MAG: FxsA family protein [Desulfuromonadales bacterium]|nr:FxsA family protein [Desulfuromonadales bacterium]
MFIKLLLIFTLVPVCELYLLIEVGRILGTGTTIALILLTGAAGAWLARSQGLDILRRIQTEAAQGQMPANSLLDGMMILIGGLLLLTPGFATDLFGFSCLIPASRALWRHALAIWLEKRLRQGTVTIYRV